MNNENASYFELQSYAEDSSLDVRNDALIEAMRISAIQGFGWSIGLVMNNDAYRPKSKDKAVEAVIKTDESFDTWTLTSKGELYILKTLFENKRDASAIFIDVRLVRLLEAFARVAALYKKLGLSNDKRIKIQFKYGGLLNKKLKIATQNRMPILTDKISNVDSFSRTHEQTLGELLDIENLLNIVVKFGRDLFQIFDAYDLKEDLAKEMIKEHRVYQGIVLAFSTLQN